ncbi:SET domain-containing protein 9 isoform X4 [Falco cherrug]|uniref:SET domain-containing protein 9 isoform X4 n=1 Tax=Falco cherrug TaxID=345164 RepID=UPI002479C03F|nr:SET domain-containing protein 9 isoform X4 [Falco cherrug]
MLISGMISGGFVQVLPPESETQHTLVGVLSVFFLKCLPGVGLCTSSPTPVLSRLPGGLDSCNFAQQLCPFLQEELQITCQGAVIHVTTVGCFRSCSRRDQLGPFQMSDESWLTAALQNPLAVGQYVNNCTHEKAANVCYQEFDVPRYFPIELKQYLPNIVYSHDIERSIPWDQIGPSWTGTFGLLPSLNVVFHIHLEVLLSQRGLAFSGRFK